LVELTFQVFFVDPQIDRSSQAPKKWRVINPVIPYFAKDDHHQIKHLIQ
jgi:hypothetical protein